MKQIFLIKGMSCASCASHINKAVSKINGVNEVNVNLIDNKMLVDFDEKKVKIKDIILAVSNAGYEAYTKDNKKEKKDYSLIKLIISFVLLFILMYFSMGNMMLGFPTPDFLDHHENPIGFSVIQLIIVTPIIILNFHYFISGFKKLFKFHPNMDSLIAIGATFSILYGIYCLIMIILGHNEYHEYLYFESAGMILTLVSLGKYLENISKKKTTKSIKALMDLSPKVATLLKDEQEIIVPIEEVKIDDLVIVKEGNIIPVDGTIIKGNGLIDESNISGESMPVSKKENNITYASTILKTGYLIIKVNKTYDNSNISNIIKLVNEASNSKAPISKIVDKISLVFIPTIFVIAIITFIVNLIISKNFELSFNFAITVIVISCPCALGLATPLSIMVSTGKGAQMGLLIKNAEILQNAHNIKTIVLDKTGTITEGKPSVIDFISYDNDIDLLSIVYSIESKSSHPLSYSIINYGKINKANNYDVNDFSTLDGIGIVGIINNEKYFIGNKKIFDYLNIEDDEILNIVNDFEKDGKTTLIVVNQGNIIGIITIKDQIKQYSVEAIKQFKKQNIDVVLLTGDNQLVANKVGKEVGIDQIYSEVLPIEKSQIINNYKKDNKHLVAMVGDGVNDAVALSSADIGIAIGGGSDVALQSADIILLKNNLMDVNNAIRLSKRTLFTIKLGLFWAFIYNVICVLFATGFMYYINGFKMNPMIASVAMSISSVFVVLNALTINLFKPNKEENKEDKIELKTFSFYVEDMMCSHCEKKIRESLSTIENIVNVDIDMTKKKVTITYRNELDKNKIKQLINDRGYSYKE